MTETPEEAATVEEPDESKYLVVDPDDYQTTKKLESIYKTKQQVLNIRENRGDIIKDMSDNFSTKQRTGLDMYSQRLSQAVAQYGSELLPLIEEGLEKGTLSEDDLVVSLSEERLDVNVVHFVKYDGRHKHNGEFINLPEPNSLAVYRQLERIQRRLGLGLDIEEQKGPAEI
jgi:hypothetical protein